jgi:hypothetical protein
VAAGYRPVAARTAPGGGLDTVREVEEFFAKTCFTPERLLGEPGGNRHFLNWYHDTPRGEMRRRLLAEVEVELGDPADKTRDTKNRQSRRPLPGGGNRGASGRLFLSRRRFASQASTFASAAFCHLPGHAGSLLLVRGLAGLPGPAIAMRADCA